MNQNPNDLHTPRPSGIPDRKFLGIGTVSIPGQNYDWQWAKLLRTFTCLDCQCLTCCTSHWSEHILNIALQLGSRGKAGFFCGWRGPSHVPVFYENGSIYSQFYCGGNFHRNNALNLLEWWKAWLPFEVGLDPAWVSVKCGIAESKMRNAPCRMHPIG